MCKILCVTDAASCREDLLVRLDKVCAGRPDAVLLRAKDLTPDAYLTLYGKAAAVGARYGVPVIAHSHAVAEAPGVHLPLPLARTMRPAGRFGVSVHAPEEAREAAALGAAWLVAGHIFATDCKRGLPGRGLGYLRAVCAAADVPVYAIGGITPESIADVLDAGAAGACIMSALMTCEDPARYIALLRRNKHAHG